MAPRSDRQIIKDRIDRAISNCADACSKLGEVVEKYMESGNPDLTIELIMAVESLDTVALFLEKFRKERV